MRAFCLEYGVAIRQGAGVFKIDLPRVIADESNDLTPTMRRLLAELFEDLGRLEKRIAEVTREIEGLAARTAARRLMMVPGIGRWRLQRCLQPPATVSSLGKLVTWRPGLGWFRSNIPRDEEPRC